MSAALNQPHCSVCYLADDHENKEIRPNKVLIPELVDFSDSSEFAPVSQSHGLASQETAGDFVGKRFILLDGQKWFKILNNSKLIEELEVEFGKNESIKSLIEGDDILKTVTDLQPFVSTVLYLFWPNLPSIKVDTDNIEVLVRDWVYKLSSSIINQMLDIPQVDERTYRLEKA